MELEEVENIYFLYFRSFFCKEPIALKAKRSLTFLELAFLNLPNIVDA